MVKNMFDFDNGNFVYSISDTMAIDADGNMMMRMGNNMAMDMDTRELHMISSWNNDEDEDW